MTNYKLINYLILLTLFAGCGPVKVVSHQTPGTDLKSYSSFSIKTNESITANDLETKSKIEDGIITEMESLGYTYSTKSDLTVSYQIILGTETNVRQDNNYYPYYGRYYRFNTVDVDRFSEGIFLIEIRETKRKKIVWQGSVDLKINRRSKKRMDLEEIVHLIYLEYPGNQVASN